MAYMKSLCEINRYKPTSTQLIARKFFWVVIPVLTLIASSCSITKHVPDGKYLLNSSTINVSSKDVKPADLETYLRQKPNKRIIGMRVHLRIYSLANPYKFKGFNRWLKTIGEEPVILDTFLTEQSSDNIELYLKSKGYYHAVIRDTIEYIKSKKAKVTYNINPKDPYIIGRISYIVEDTVLNRIILKDTVNSLVKSGQLFDADMLQEERGRLQAYVQNSGFYFFNKEYITFTADTSVGNHKVDLILNIRNRYIMLESGTKLSNNFLKYKINKVFFYPNFDPRVIQSAQKLKEIDTVYHNEVEYIFKGDPGIELSVVDQANLIRPGSIYSDDIVKKTQSNLSSLRLFRMVNIFFSEEVRKEKEKSDEDTFLFFTETEKKDTTPTGLLNCYIQLSAHTLQSYQVEFVGTNTSGAFGAETNLIYQHKNLFKGAEILDVRFRGLIETVQKSTSEFAFNNSLELGGSVGLNIPRFLSPFSGKEFIEKYSPRTQITTSYNFQRRPEYTRTIASLIFGYSWKNARFITHGINPVEVNAINSNLNRDFEQSIKDNEYLKNSYKNQIVTVSSYNITFNNQNLQKSSSYTYMRLNIESSGNILATAYSKFGTKYSDGTYKILKTSFSQFVRSDINISYHQLIDEYNTVVYRVFFGVGYPYGNSKALPFDKKYFSGGANGVRAWDARSLGPGSVKAADTTYYNQTGDIKLEANLEYRFKLFWQLEGALFFDAGNIWAFKDENPKAQINLDNFYKQIALGTGLGIRANLGFLTVRFDFGLKLYDPAIPDDNPDIEKWVPLREGRFTSKDRTFIFGIGYPF